MSIVLIGIYISKSVCVSVAKWFNRKDDDAIPQGDSHAEPAYQTKDSDDP